MKIMDFALDQKKLEEGVKLYLEDGSGNEVDEWISLYYVHSDAAQAAVHEAMRRDFQNGTLKKDATDVESRYSWCLVAGWSLDEECTEENIKHLFSVAPDIRNKVTALSERRKLFFGKPEGSSSSGSKKSSNSKK